MTEDGRYTAQVTVVKQECPDADDSEIEEEFRRYEEEFLIPPEDALRSVVRKFQTASGMEVTNLASPAKVEKKVNRFSELGADDRNVTIEVAVISYSPRIQMVRGEERQRTIPGRTATNASAGTTRTGASRARTSPQARSCGSRARRSTSGMTSAR